MKICAVSPKTKASRDEILDFISECKTDPDLIVLPGFCKDGNHPNCKEVSNSLKKGVFVFVETFDGKSATPWLVSSSESIQMPDQIFKQKPTAGELDRLQEAWPQRTHNVKGREISFAICGEIDAFTKKGSVKKERNLPYEVLINPTHFPRGRWNHLGVKLETLSLGKAVVHVANNPLEGRDVTSHLRIYVNGEIMPRYGIRNIAWSQCEI